MKISILVPNISLPTIGAALRIARSIQPEHEVDIVGADMGQGVCPMYRGAYDFKAVATPRLYRYPNYFHERNKIIEMLDGDLIISLKAFGSSLPIALKAKEKRGVPVIVYLDEWDGAIFHMLPFHQKISAWIRGFHHPLEDHYCPLIEQKIDQADHVVSTTTFLQKKFGGTVIPLGADTSFFRPQPENEITALKQQLGYENYRLLGFGGVVRPHKGIENVLEALAQIGDPTIKLLVIGPRMSYLEELMNHPRWGSYVLCIGAHPDDSSSQLNAEVHRKMPLYLSLADALLVPLNDTQLSRSQMPCKVFEAMAMGKPVIASNVSDLPHTIQDSGWLVPSQDTAQIAQTIQEVLSSPTQAGERGQSARQRAEKLYDQTHVKNLWLETIQHLQ